MCVVICVQRGRQSIMENELRTGWERGQIDQKPVTNEPNIGTTKKAKAQRAPQMVNFLRKKLKKLEWQWAAMVIHPNKIAVHRRVWLLEIDFHN